MKRALRSLPFVLWAACADPVCPAVADHCATECYEIRGVPVSRCSDGGVIACLDDGPETLTTDVGCAVRLEDGHVFRLSSGTLAGYLAQTGAWRRCTAEDIPPVVDCPS